MSVKHGTRRPLGDDKSGWAGDHPNVRKKAKTKAVPAVLKARGGAILKNQNPRQRPVQGQPLKKGKGPSASASEQCKKTSGVTAEEVCLC